MNARRAVFALMLGAAGGAVAGCGATPVAKPPSPTHVVSRYAGATVVSNVAAPQLALTNYDGTPVTLTQFRGKVVLVTFVYTHCPNVCPVIVSNLGTALTMLGAEARNVEVVAVTTDPAGDTPQAVSAFLAARGMTGRMLYLLGTPAAVKIAWLDWQIEVSPDSTAASVVDHTAAVFGVSATGRLVTLYASNVAPSDFVHDVPLLANE